MNPGDTLAAVRDRLDRGFPVELLIALVVATVLRVYRLGDESIWLDEAVTVTVAQESWWFLLFEFPGADPHPPLHYLLTKAWISLAGTSEFSVRLLSVLFGIATVPLLYYLALRLFDRFTATAAAVFFAIAPFQIWYAQEARMYALFVLLTVASFFALVRLTDQYTSARAVTYVIVAALLAYTHMYALFILFVQGIFIVWRWLRVESPEETPLALPFQAWFRTYLGLGVAISPWLALLFMRLSTSTERIGWISEPEPAVFRRIFTLFSYGYTSDSMYWHQGPSSLHIVIAAGCILLALGGVMRRSALLDGAITRWGISPKSIEQERAAILLLSLWVVVPIALAYILSHLITPFLILRPTTAMAPAFLLLLAVGARTLASVSIPYRSGVPYVVAALLISGMVVPLPAYYAEDHKEEWRDAAAFIDRTAEPGDVVLISHPYNDQPFLYYFDNDDVEVVGVWPDDDLSELQDSFDDASQVYIVLRGVWGEDRDRLIQRTGASIENHAGAEHREYIGVEVIRFQVIEETG